MATVKDDDSFGGHIPLIISTLVVVLTVVGGFWSLADPRGELKNIRDNYLTIREHTEFTTRVSRDIARIETRDDDLEKNKADKDDLAVLRTTHQNDLTLLNKSLQAQIDHLQQAIDKMTEDIDRHKERDTDRFINGKPKDGK